MISWHSAPEYSYKGYLYRPEVEDYYNEDGSVDNRKIWHNIVSRLEPNKVVFTTNHSPYQWMTEDEFKAFINQMERVVS